MAEQTVDAERALNAISKRMQVLAVEMRSWGEVLEHLSKVQPTQKAAEK